VSGVRHIGCPGCGGVVSISELDRVTRCTYCGVRLLVEGAPIVPEHWVEPRVDEDRARRALLEAMRGPEMPPHLIRQSRLHKAQLLFAPYNEVYARRLGTLTLVEPLGEFDEEALFTSRTTATSTTRVVMGDLHRVEPAAEMPGFGLEERGYAAQSHERALVRLPLDRRRAGALGSLVRPTRPVTRLLDELRLDNKAATVRDRTSFEEIRAQRVYYPIWRLKYRHAGRLWSTTFDGVTGELMAARMPVREERRVGWFLVSAMTIGFAVGKTAAFVAMLSLATSGFGAFAAVVFVAAAFLAAIGLAAYEQFRYPQELVVDGASREIVRVGGPKETLVDRFLSWCQRRAEEEQSRRGQGT
jgi:DNA-directed RNA polymerase subunit RPC12/RpoP